jgi:rhamnulose-1-phosphate aldolase/alcohol dehydrogenase
LFSGQIGWVDWQRPGFDLGLKLEVCINGSPNLRGIMLGGHGLFTWGSTAYESYINTLEVIERYSGFLEDNYNKKRPVFGGWRLEPLPAEKRKAQAATLAPVLRGLCSSQNRMIGHFTDDARVLEFINSHDKAKLAPLGTSCPDHFLRTKISPLVLTLQPEEDLSDITDIRSKLEPAFDQYRAMYHNYYESCKQANSPAIRDANPVIILYPGVGMFSFAKDKQTARVTSEFYINAINVMKGAEAVSEYVALEAQEAFNIEYWLLEEAKLQRMPKPKPLSGKVALITGSGGGIGKAIARKFAEEGACIILSDHDTGRLEEANVDLLKNFGKDAVSAVPMDVTSAQSAEEAFKAAALAFGGVDIIVNCAGLSISKPFTDHTETDWDLLYNVMQKGQFLVSKYGVEILRKQALGGDILNIVSKNGLMAGPNNVAYGSVKAAQMHMSRLLATELGPEKIRVNIINPDAVIADSKIWQGGWAEGRAKAYGVCVDELPAYYAKRTLLNEVILPEDVANACFAFVAGLLSKSTGNILNVDGGLSNVFPR